MNRDTEKLIAEQAAEWLIRLETATAQEREEFWNWVRQSPLHVREVLAAQACSAELGQLLREGRIDVDAFVRSANNVHEIGNRDEHARDDTLRAIPAPRRARLNAASSPANRTRRVIAAAAFFVALLAAAIVALYEMSDGRITTAAGEWQTKLLDDGSILQVGPRTKLLIEFTDERRVIRLSRGEALFHVAHDTQRPFLVETELATARAVGTAFAVSLDDAQQVRVTVQEGLVAVARRPYSQALRTSANAPPGQSITLKAGEQVAVTAASPLAAVQVDVETALAWTKRRLIFEHETVEQAAHEFNRRNKLQIEVLDPKLLGRAVRGVFEAADPESFAAYLGKQGAVVVMDENSGTLLIAPYPDAATRKAND
jgi:transmembrane sensor